MSDTLTNEQRQRVLMELQSKVYKANSDINAIVRALAEGLPFGYEISATCPDAQYYQLGNGVEIPRIFLTVVAS